MVRFAHIADVHLGGWKQEAMQQLNFESFRKAIDVCLKSELDFVLIAGDLFDSAYPPIEVLRDTFAEFKRLKDAKIPVFLIAGSHDYSVSGKTFLDVLEKAGFCKNVFNMEERENTFFLSPTVYNSVAIYGYPGKKSGLEIPELRKVKFHDSPGLYKIFMLHTTLDKVKGSLPIDAIEADSLPLADYYALGHIHVDFQYKNHNGIFVYASPIFPNNFAELEDLEHGAFYIVDTNSQNLLKKIELKLKEVVSISITLHDAVYATSQIISELEKKELRDKIVLLRISGELENGKISDIKFNEIENFVKEKRAYFLLKNTHDLTTKEISIDVELKQSENIEEEIIQSYSKKNPSHFNDLIPSLMNALSIEKQEDERSENFTRRIMEESKKILGV